MSPKQGKKVVDVKFNDGIAKWHKPFGCRRLLNICSLSTLFTIATIKGLYTKMNKYNNQRSDGEGF